jgi:DNA adenine methylase
MMLNLIILEVDAEGSMTEIQRSLVGCLPGTTGEEAGPLRPLLRWAGGKRWLLPNVSDLIAATEIHNYHEPFVGGAAVFFGLSIGAKAYLSDLNINLINTYKQVRDDPEGVWRFLRRYKNTESCYYLARSAKPRVDASRAAQFIFLNHASFNGIYRVNLAGKYNVPYGRRTSYNPPRLDDLRHASSRLRSAVLAERDFAAAIDYVGPGDLVFLDPPYTVAHNHNGFVRYNHKLFSFADQHRLSGMVDTIRARGAYYILTNAAHNSIAELFEKGDRRIETFRKNAVGGATAARGIATEYLFTNLASSS